MKIGFEFFKTRKIGEELDFTDLEIQHDIKIPYLYKLFLNTFDTSVFKNEVFKIKGDENKWNVASFEYKPDKDVGFTSFVYDINIAFKIYKESNELFKKRKYFPVGDSSVHARGIVVGTLGEERDKIFLDTEYPNRYVFVANNIFEFVRGIEEYEIKQEFIYSKINPEILYKNWGEDFWRVRDEGDIL